MGEGEVQGRLVVTLAQSAPFSFDLSFAVAPGEFMALIGPSGSGKTTTLRSIAGHHRSESGRVSVGDTVWFDSAAGISLAARRRRIGLVFQSYALFPHLTAAGNVMAAMGDLPAGRRRRAAFDLLGRVHLAGLENALPARLSGGQQQRVAIARALARRPDVLLLDEPFSAIDRPVRAGLYAELAGLRTDLAMPIVLVTHDLDEAARLADTATILDAGRVLAHGPIGDILSRPDLGAVVDRDVAGGVLHATVRGHDAAAGTTILDHPGGILFHPLTDAAVGARVRLRVRARDVALAVGEPGNLSIRNRLAATVTAIAEGHPPMVDVRLDAGGEPVLATVTRDAARALDLAVGQPVTALVKAASFDGSSTA